MAYFRVIIIFSLFLTVVKTHAQPKELKALLENRYWTYTKYCDYDTCIIFLPDSIANVHFIDFGHCSTISECEMFEKEYQLIDDPISGEAEWMYNACGSMIVMQSKVSDSIYRVNHISERGKFSGRLTITENKISFVGESDNKERLILEFIKIELPEKLKKLLKQ